MGYEINYEREVIVIDKSKLIEAKIPVMDNGEAMKIVKVNDDYVLCELGENEKNVLSIEQASYDADRLEHLYGMIIKEDSASYSTTPEELSNLAKNTQFDKDKIIKINSIIQYNVNKEDIIGKVVEIIENNINTNFTVNYPNIPIDGKKKKNSFDKFKLAIDEFNNQIDLKGLIQKSILSTYVKGNFIPYLRGESLEKGYTISDYPLNIIDISNLLIDGENVVTFNIKELKSKINNSLKSFKKLKASQPIEIQTEVEQSILKDYPKEVGVGYEEKDDFCILDPKRVGVMRINQFDGYYGLSPIFKSLKPQLMLETFDNVDRSNAIAKSKKIYFQKTRAELLNDPDNTDYISNIQYSQASLLKAMALPTVVYTGMPFVESLEILEPKTVETDPETILSYRNRVLNALGIGFLSNESKSSYNTTEVNVKELLKTINKIARQLERIINKFYKTFCKDNGFNVEHAPTLSIASTENLDLESLSKLVDLLFSKVGVSYRTIFEKLGLDYNTEVNRRKEENELENKDGTIGLENVFTPHPTSYTVSAKEDNLLTKGDGNGDKNDNGSEKNKDIDKQMYDKNNNKEKV